MALIDCPECGTATSTEATFCPQCGFPVKRLGGHAQSSGGGVPQIPYTVLDATKSIVGRVLFGGLVFASGIGFDAPPTKHAASWRASTTIPTVSPSSRSDWSSWSGCWRDSGTRSEDFWPHGRRDGVDGNATARRDTTCVEESSAAAPLCTHGWRLFDRCPHPLEDRRLRSGHRGR